MPSKDDYARAVLQAGRDIGVTPRGIVIGFATVSVECDWLMYANSKVPESLNLPHDAVGSDGFSVGLFQQQIVKSANGYWWADCATCMDPYKSASLFFGRLKKLDYNGPNSPGSYAQAVQGSAFPDRYDQRMADAQQLYDRLATGAPPVTQTVDPRIARLLAVRPAFNEFANWCQRADGKANWQDREGVTIDCFLAHTQEAAEDDDNAALDLSNFLKSTIGGPNPVSYHDSVRQASDGGVTVVNSVDTANAAWAVGNSNNRSINRCFAGSSANWTRAQWLTQSKAIDVMAYLMVLDAVKCNSNAPEHVTFGPNYDGKPPPVFSDHRYCTKVLRDGNTHVDCGDNFPADIYGASVAKYWAAANATTPTPEVPPVTQPKQFPHDYTDRELLEYIADQIGPGYDTWGEDGDLGRNAKGQRRTFRAGIAALMRKVGA